MAPIIGIDLGTSNSSAAVVRGGRPVTIPSREGPSPYGKNFPSVIGFQRDGTVLVGEPARRQAAANPEGTVAAFKRKMGSGHKYSIFGKEYTPVDLSAILLRKIREDASAHLGEPVEKAVVTVPAYFNDAQRTATKKAGEMAGLEAVRILNEPTAACLAYGLDRKGSHRVLVFDLGGGTLDVTLLEFQEGVFQVMATSGDTQLGGTDMDRALVERLSAEAGPLDASSTAKLREAAEEAKIRLSAEEATEINLPFLGGRKGFRRTLTRAELEGLFLPLLERCRGPLLQALADARLDPPAVESAVLVGGPTRMPAVRRLVASLLGKEPEAGIDPMEVVAHGAAIQGSVLAGESPSVLLLDVTPLSLGIETMGGLMNILIPRNTTIPTKAGEMFSNHVEGQRKILIHVLQGEREMAADNFSLGKFYLEVEPAPAMTHRIGVQFTIDENGILQVLAMDTRTGKKVETTVKSAVDVADERVQEMVKASVEKAMEDMKKRQTAEAKLGLQTAVLASVKALKEFGARLTPEERREADGALLEAHKALETEEFARVNAAKERLDKATRRLAAIIMEEARAQMAGRKSP
ncbi:MAG: Hsp70 family protein [Halobacteria archaeon]